MDILKTLVDMIGPKLGITDPSMLANALGALLGDGAGGIDIAGLVQKFSGGGMEGLLSSFLGDGENSPMDASQIVALLGQDKVDAFASDVGVETETASNALSDVLPQLIDQVSTGGELNSADLLGGISKLF